MTTDHILLQHDLRARLKRLGEDPDQFEYSDTCDRHRLFLAGRLIMVVCDRNEDQPRTVFFTTDMMLGTALEMMGRL